MIPNPMYQRMFLVPCLSLILKKLIKQIDDSFVFYE